MEDPNSGDQMNISGENEEEYLYELLGVPEKATKEEIKKGYYRMALKYHPDKNPGDKSASEKFLKIGKAYEILSNDEKRAVYDETGTILDDDALNAFSSNAAKNWDEYFRALFKKLSEDDLTSFETAYKGSNTEEEDVMEAYKKCTGNLEEMIEYIPLATSYDLDRFVDKIDKAIELGDVPDYSAYARAKKRIGKIKSKLRESEEKEAKEFEKVQRKAKKSKTEHGSSNLELQKKIKTKQQLDMEKLAADLEAKYSKGKKGKSKAKDFEEPSEEEFQKIQQRMLENKKKRS